MAVSFAHLPHSGDENDVLLRQACEELERRLRTGQDCRAEEILSAYPSLNNDSHCLLELVLFELDVRRRLRESLNPEQWYIRYPQWRERLWLWFQVESNVTGPEGDTLPIVRSTPAESSATPSGTVFGHFRLLEELGHGGMGVVYRAEDLLLGRQVALKRIRSGALARAHERERFAREARAAARLKHPHITAVYEIGEVGQELFLVLELLPKGSLVTQRERFRQQPHLLVAFMEKVARAVHYAHSQGVLHRDLKPSNILLDEAGEPHIADFGLAKFLQQNNAELTQSDFLVGTPAYLAPEILQGGADQASPRSDIWALGVILYELLAGQRPFRGETILEITEQIVHGVPPPLRARQRGISRDLETICLKCLEKNPAQRYASAAELADDLARLATGEPIRARPPSWPRRLRYWMRRHRRLCIVLILLPLAALAASLLLPSEPAFRQAERQLRAGQAVTLIDRLGPPRWWEWLFSDTVCSQSTEATHPFALATTGLNLLELLPHVPCPTFRYRAKIQQARGASGLIGIYFGHQAWSTDKGTEHCLVQLLFSDALPLITNKEQRLVCLEVQRRRDDSATPPVSLCTSLHAHRYAYFPPRKLANGQQEDPPWHQLAVEVTPAQVQVFWEGQHVGSVSTAEMRRRLHQMLADPRAPAAAQPPADDPLGTGLGLVVINSHARVCSVVVEPLSEADP